VREKSLKQNHLKYSSKEGLIHRKTKLEILELKLAITSPTKLIFVLHFQKIVEQEIN